MHSPTIMIPNLRVCETKNFGMGGGLFSDFCSIVSMGRTLNFLARNKFLDIFLMLFCLFISHSLVQSLNLKIYYFNSCQFISTLKKQLLR